MVPPDRELADLGYTGAGLLREERARPVVVEPRHRAPAVVGDRVRVRARDEAVRVGGIADDDDANARRRVPLDGLALLDEDRPVLPDEVAPLHPRPARDRSDEQHPVRALMRLGAVGARGQPGQQGIGAVLELHEHALGSLDHLRDVREPQVDLDVGTEHLAGGDAREERVGDLADGAGDDDLDLLHRFASAPP